MPSYLTFRILKGLFVVVLISLLTFIVMRMMPGDPVYLLLGEGQIPITDAQIAAIRAKWGLDRPLPEQYLVWAANLLRGDFGESLIRAGVPVRQMIFEAMPVTATLNVLALALAIVVALPMGIAAAVRRNTWVDYTTNLVSALGIATPNFWLSLMSHRRLRAAAPLAPAVRPAHLAGLHPAGGRDRDRGDGGAHADHPRRRARAPAAGLRPHGAQQGLSPSALVLYRHVVANALLPVVTVVGFRIAFILSGTIIVETVFALPGIGRLFVDSVLRLDYQVVQSLVVVFAVLVVVVNLLTDLVYALVDPRIRIS
jgi:peptide/nickel transport system permease protein